MKFQHSGEKKKILEASKGNRQKRGFIRRIGITSLTLETIRAMPSKF